VGKSERTHGTEEGGDSAARRLTREVASMQAALLGKLHEELAEEGSASFAAAAQGLAEDFGSVTATSLEALLARRGAGRPVEAPPEQAAPPGQEVPGPGAPEPAPPVELHPSLYRSREMRHRLDQMIETNKRYGHPFGLVVFDVDGPGTRSGHADNGQRAALALVAAALNDSVRLVDESFQLEEDGICVLAPQQTTVEGVRMAERLLRILSQVEASGGMRIGVTAGVVACPEHGIEAEGLLHKADEAMWRARAVGQPVGIGPLEAVQDR
jgi:diguanylate cyclase (GGDEF)-like protein